MDVIAFSNFINEQIHLSAEKLGDAKHSSNDDVSLGKLTFYLAVRQLLDSKATQHPTGKMSGQNLGLVGAFNDTLQKLGLIEAGKTFMAKLDTPGSTFVAGS